MKNNIIKKLEMLLKINLFLALLAVLITGGTVIAQDTNERRSTGQDSANQRAARADEKLVKIENRVQEVINKKIFTESDAQELKTLQESYAREIWTAFETVIRTTERVAQSPQSPENARVSQDVGNDLEIIENKAIQQLNRVNEIKKKLALVERDIGNGRIKLEDPATSKLFSPNIMILGEYESDCDTTENESIFQTVSYTKSLIRSVAIKCIAPCKAKNWGVCLACVAPIATGLNPKWNTYSSCNSNCDRKKWWQRPFCYAGCLGTFVTWIA
jgi:hypothetical protein